MLLRFCAACRTRLAASGGVVVFGNAPVHAACWSELRKPPGKSAMDSAYGRALQGTSRQGQERPGILGLDREQASTALRTDAALTMGLPPEVVAAPMASSLMRSTSDRTSAPLRPFIA